MSHIQNTITQYNLPSYEERIDKARNRAGLLEHFEDQDVQMSVAANMVLLDTYDETIDELELHLESRAKIHDASTYYLLRTIPGIGKILSLTILYEIHEISRFPDVGNFLSYGRLVAGTHESAGKKKGSRGRKMGNVYLKWAFSEAAALYLRCNSLGIERADLAVRHPSGAMICHRDLATASLPLAWARAQNVRRAEVYVRPARGYAWPLVFLDDVDTPRARAVARKYDALLVETSPAGGCHVWLACDRQLQGFYYLLTTGAS